MLKNIINNSLITSLPSILSLFLSLICVPIFLREIGLQNYGEYIFMHLLTSLGLVLNFGVGKLLIANSINKKQNLFYNAIIVTLCISIGVFLTNYIIFLSLKILNLKLIFITLGICLTIIYYTIESNLILKKKFKLLSIFNFLFFAFSLNAPIIIIIFSELNYNVSQVFIISLLIKFGFLFLFLFFEIIFLKK